VTERADVVIVGSGFGGSITAWRLAELYRAAGVDPAAIVVLERGRRYRHIDFRQSTDLDHLSDVYLLIQGQGAQVVTANAVGGGSNLYLAASLRSPRETFERRDQRPDDGPPRRMWPRAISRAGLNRYYARAEQGLRVKRPTWPQVSKSGGLWAATLASAGPYLRPGAAGHLAGALRQRQVVSHRVHLRGQELARHQLPVGG
jgi:choline dehydrogenase-like flavoprotein